MRMKHYILIVVCQIGVLLLKKKKKSRSRKEKVYNMKFFFVFFVIKKMSERKILWQNKLYFIVKESKVEKKGERRTTAHIKTNRPVAAGVWYIIIFIQVPYEQGVHGTVLH